jgi:hypothetical protein
MGLLLGLGRAWPSRQAMEEEVTDINALKAWRELSPTYPLPPGEQWLPTKWVYTRKPPDSKLRCRLKARLVARGDRGGPRCGCERKL